VVKEAQALHEHGHWVHVIATRTLDLVEARDQDILARAPWSCERVDLRPRLVRALLRTGQVASRTVHALSGAASALAYSAVTPALAARAGRHAADLYIAHYVAALPAAASAARRHGAAYAFDAEDFHLGDLPDTERHLDEKRLIRAVEGRWLPGCVYVTAASPGIADAYQAEYGLAGPTVVLNVFPRSQGPATPTARGTAEPGPSFYWFSQTIGADRGLETAVAAIGAARSQPHLYLRGTPAYGFAEALQRVAHAHGVADRIHLLDPAPPSQMEQLASAYDVGLVAETGYTPNHRLALSNKQFTYLLAGLPTVLSDTPAHKAFAPLAGGAVRLFDADRPAALAAALDDLLCDEHRLASARIEAHRLGQTRFNWDVEKARLLDRVDRVLGGSVQ